MNVNIAIVITLLVIVALFKREKLRETNIDLFKRIASKYHYFLLGSLLLIAFFVRAYQLDLIPYGLHVDEVGMGYDAWALANFGVDRALNEYPVYLVNYGGGQSALYGYLAAFFIKLLGFSIIAIRLPSLILSSIALVLTYLMVKKYKGNNTALLVTFILTIAPWHIMQSRWGLDCNLLSSIMIISIYLLVRANKWYDFTLAGIFFGFSLYTYALSYITIPLFLLLSLPYMFYTKKINFAKLVALGVPIFFISLPLMLFILVNNDYIKQINWVITIPRLPYYRGGEISLDNLIRNIGERKLLKIGFFKDALVYNALPEYGPLFLCSLPLFLIGIVELVKNIDFKKFNLDIILFIALLSVAICTLLINDPNINKANALFIPLIYVIVIGIKWLGKRVKFAYPIIIVAYTLNFASFTNYYFGDYKNLNQPYFANDLYKVSRYIKENIDYQDKYIYIENHVHQPLMYVTLAFLPNPFTRNVEMAKFIVYNQSVPYFNPNYIYAYFINDARAQLIDSYVASNFTVVEYSNYYIVWQIV